MKIIIANTNVQAFIKASDNILAQYNTNGEIPENIKGQAVLSVLKNVSQNKQWFDVTAINQLAKMNEVVISEEHQEFYSALHCIHYNEMTTETREYLFATIVSYFKSNIIMANIKYE